MNKEQLIAFEDDIAALFNAGKIRAPVHLYSGNEEQIIASFRPIRAQDWVDRKSTRLNSSHIPLSRMPSSA